MGLVANILRSARERERRINKVRAAAAALTFDEKGAVVAELLNELRAGPPKPARRPRKPGAPSIPAQVVPRKTIRERVTEALAQTSPLNTVGIHAVIERTAPGVVSKHTVAAEVSGMLSKGLLVRAGTTARGASFALANGGTH
jgi:hypothetical protein